MDCDALAARANLPAGDRWGLAGLSLAMLLPSLGTSIANVALPTFAQAFGAPIQAVQWITLAYLLAVTALIVSVGRLGDLIGRRRLLLGGTLLFTAASLLCGGAPNLWVLIAARAIQGVGAAVMMALTMSLATEILPKSRTGSAMGLLGTMSAVGTASGPSLGGLLIAGFGWRAIFLVMVPLGIAAFLLTRRHLPAESAGPQDGRAGFDKWGTLLLALTLTFYALAATIGRGSFGFANAALLTGAGAGLALFLRSQAKAASPLIPLALLGDPVLSARLAMSILVSTVIMATLVVGPFHLAGGLELDAAPVGLALSAGPLAAALTGVPAGRLTDRIGSQQTTMLGLGAMAAGSCSLSMIPAALGVAGYLLPMVVIAIGYALFQTANNMAVMAGAEPSRRGLVSGMLNLSRNLGLITGASVMGAVFAFVSGSTDVAAGPALVAAGTRATFAVATALLVLALALAAATLTWRRLASR